jgi:hypothetical protein
MDMTPVPDQKQQPVSSRRLVVSQLTEAAEQGQESKLELKSSCSKKKIGRLKTAIHNGQWPFPRRVLCHLKVIGKDSQPGIGRNDRAPHRGF